MDADKFEEVLAALALVEKLEEQIASIKSQNSLRLAAIEESNGGRTSFEYKNRYYGIRARNGTRYLAGSDAPLGRSKK